MDDSRIEEVLEGLKQKAAELNSEDPAGFAGVGIRHLTRIKTLVEEDESDDIIVDVNNNEQYTISKLEKYACVVTENLVFHYRMTDDLTGVEEMITQ